MSKAGSGINEYYISGDSVITDSSDATYNYYLVQEWTYKIEKTGKKEVPSDNIRRTVYSDKRNAYPNDGKSGSYWYVYSDIQ